MMYVGLAKSVCLPRCRTLIGTYVLGPLCRDYCDSLCCGCSMLDGYMLALRRRSWVLFFL